MDQDLSLHEFIKENKLTSQHKKLVSELNQEGIFTVEDLLSIQPKKTMLIPPEERFDQACEGEIFRGSGNVIQFKSRPLFYRKSKFMLYFVQMIICEEENKDNTLIINWHNCYSSLLRKLKDLKQISFYGKVEDFRGKLCLNNPTIIENGKIDIFCSIEYPALGEISSKRIKNIFNKIKDQHFSILKHHLDPVMEESNQLKHHQIHSIYHGKQFTSNLVKNRDLFRKAKDSLAYLNLLEFELKAVAKRKNREQIKAIKLELQPYDNYREILESLFSYKLTLDQTKTLEQVYLDLLKPYPMNRLLQGDVGCGKSSISYASALIMAIHRQQTVIMVPTETLAHQQFRKLFEFINLYNEKYQKNIRVALLTGSTHSSIRKQMIEDCKSNQINILIGTHSLFNEEIELPKLQLIIVDEQQKFGVNQRLRLSGKNTSAHYLSMTATPIPRTQQETLSQEIDISIIQERPFSTQIKTRIISKNNFNKFLSFVQTRLELGEQIYVVTPKIDAENTEGQETVNLNKAKKFFADNFSAFQQSEVHGQQNIEEKELNFNKFLTNQSQILISTTVIEVGVDNPNATVMIIFDANNFGISTLHQLRGRVGRGEKNGFCFLLPRELSTDIAEIQKLKYLEESNDGFFLAQKDLELRGAGDLYGEKQSGNKFASYLMLKKDFPEQASLAVKTTHEIFNQSNKYLNIKNYYLSSKILQKSI